MVRCIIVEDHGDTRTGYAEFLTTFGFEVKTASHGGELQTLLESWVPDAIVMDLQLPKSDGWQITRELKADPRTHDIVVVAVSACVLPADRAAAEEAGCEAFIPKPCDPMDIVEALSRLTRGKDRNG
jgi:CheY-like chemotaxis protein